MFMIKINCKTNDTVKLVDLIAFQGNLKKRTESDLEELRASLESEGLMMPFAVWRHDDKNYLLDGHGRREVLMRLIVSSPDLLDIDWPCVFVEAETEDDARKALLQITSQYGKITKIGVKQFTASIPNYRAPSINKFVAKPVKVSSSVKAPKSDKVILKIRITRDKLEQIKDIFKQFDFIEVL